MNKAQVLREIKTKYFLSSHTMSTSDGYRSASQIANAVAVTDPEEILRSVGIDAYSEIETKSFKIEEMKDAWSALENVIAYLNTIRQQRNGDKARQIVIAVTHIEDGLLRLR